MKIRRSSDADRAEISALHLNAFGRDEGAEIAELVNRLLDDETARPILSLVAESDGRLIGHILYTKVSLRPAATQVSAQILAPLAVHADFRNRGIGAQLTTNGLRRLKESGVELVFVLGYPAYYSRLGFQAAGMLGFEAPFPIPENHADAWMVHELRKCLRSRRFADIGVHGQEVLPE